MSSNKKSKPWIFLPFMGGSSNEPEKQIARSRRDRPRADDDPVVLGLQREDTVKEFANKNEEDIVQDYNSPIHMWVRKIKRETPMFEWTYANGWSE